MAGFDPANYFDAKEARKMDSFIQYGMVAGIEAVEDSGLLESITDLSRVGVAIGSGIGGIGQIEKIEIYFYPVDQERYHLFLYLDQ